MIVIVCKKIVNSCGSKRLFSTVIHRRYGHRLIQPVGDRCKVRVSGAKKTYYLTFYILAGYVTEREGECHTISGLPRSTGIWILQAPVWHKVCSIILDFPHNISCSAHPQPTRSPTSPSFSSTDPDHARALLATMFSIWPDWRYSIRGFQKYNNVTVRFARLGRRHANCVSFRQSTDWWWVNWSRYTHTIWFVIEYFLGDLQLAWGVSKWVPWLICRHPRTWLAGSRAGSGCAADAEHAQPTWPAHLHCLHVEAR